jgi:RNase P subunit RPR2
MGSVVCPRCRNPATAHVWFRQRDDREHVIIVLKCRQCGYEWQMLSDRPPDEPPDPHADSPKKTPPAKRR